MDIYIGLGSNRGDRPAHLRETLRLLQTDGLEILRVSPVVESPALLPPGAAAAWNLPYLNLVLHGRTRSTPEQLHATTQEIERRLGRTATERWAPRPIDIDLLLWGEVRLDTPTLRIPHPSLHRRAFVLTPLSALAPQLRIPGLPGTPTVLECARQLGQHIPLWMGILNVTPDSFSDGGAHASASAATAQADALARAGAHIIDIGGQSTRPGAERLPAAQEWARIAPVLEYWREQHAHDPLRPRISIDTFYPEVAERAIAAGADLINDVGGLTEPGMLELAQGSEVEWIAMHQLGLPADPERVLDLQADPVELVSQWLEARLEHWTRSGLDPGRIIVDPGIGFGKNALQSLQLLRAAHTFRRFSLRVLVGHSRKSFMSQFAAAATAERDLGTIGASLHLCQQGVDIIRVHDVAAHVAAYRGWSHLEMPQP